MRLLVGPGGRVRLGDRAGGRCVAFVPAHGSCGGAPRAHGCDRDRATAHAACRRCSFVEARLHGIDWTSKVVSAQVKSAIILAGLSADGTTVVREAVTTRTHTEEMLVEAGADLTVEPWGEGRIVRVRASSLQPVDRTVPGDPSASAFFAVAGCVVPGQRRRRCRRLQRTGSARLRLRASADGGIRSPWFPGEPGTTTIRALAGPLTATEVASQRDSLARRDSGARRRRCRRRRHDGLLRRRRAPGQGGRPAPRRRGHGRGLRCPRHDRRGHPVHHGRGRSAPWRPLRQPGRPPDGDGGSSGGARCSPG